ncbi:MAG: hypothetical protein U0R51_08620 [Solirubrobacterales bacterium]
MTSTTPIDIRCRIDSIEEPITGRLRDEQGRSRDFRGWIELAAALTALVGEAQPRTEVPRKENHHE